MSFLTDLQRNQLFSGAAGWGVTLDDAALDRFERFGTMLYEANESINLTRVPPEKAVSLHFLDSLAPTSFWKPRPGDRILDLGTGAGFPGIPLAIAFPTCKFTLLDSTRKKLVFLDRVIDELELTGVQTLHARAGEGGNLLHDISPYDAVTARAVIALHLLVPLMAQHLKQDGQAFAYKSNATDEEIALAQPAAEAIGVSLQVKQVTLPDEAIERRIIVIRPIVRRF